MCHAGLFWSLDDAHGQRVLCLGSDPGAVIVARPVATQLDNDYLRVLLGGSPADERTPYLGVHRVPPGGRTIVGREIVGPERRVQEAWREPHLSGDQAVEAFREAFGRTVHRLAASAGPVSASLSGGLDSSYLVARLAEIDAGDPVVGFVSSPLATIAGNPSMHAIVDDLPDARTLASRYAGRVEVRAVRNGDRVQPLDAAAHSARSSWWPALIVDNQVWIRDIGEHAIARGSRFLFAGFHGNWSFSPYFPRANAPASPVWRRMARRTGAGRFRPRRQGTTQPSARGTAVDAVRLVGLGEAPKGPPQTSQAAGFSARLFHTGLPPAAVLSPAAFDNRLMIVDPYTAPDVLDVAAAITPETWGCEPWPRGFARRVMEGAVPDQIRLRVGRGAQAPDSWLWINDQRDRYLDEAAQVATTPVIGDHVDVAHLRRRIEGWAWGEPVGPPKPELGRVQAVLSLANFVRFTTKRLAELPQSG